MSSYTIPQTQKAWVAVRKGEPEKALELDSAYPVPKDFAKGEVLVKVQAAAYNPVGAKLMGMLPNFIAKRPHVAEYDFAGVVVDANGTEFHEGQEVYGWIPISVKASSKQGTFCEYTLVPSQLILPKPSHIKTTEAAGMALVGATAYHALITVLGLQPGQHLFINGGSTSVGIFAIQYAKTMGCVVTVTGSEKNEEFLRSIGVDNFIDYTKAPVHKQLLATPPTPEFDAILEAVGTADPKLYLRCESYLAPGGVFASVGPQPGNGAGLCGIARLGVEFATPNFMGGVKRKWILVSVQDRPDELKEVGKLIADGKVKPVVDSVFAFEDVLKGYERVLSGRAVGKIIVKVDPSVE